jgi:hypothetical protein
MQAQPEAQATVGNVECSNLALANCGDSNGQTGNSNPFGRSLPMSAPDLTDATVTILHRDRLRP